MDKEGITLSCDEATGTLFVRRTGTRSVSTRFANADGLLALNLDKEGVVIGLVLEGALELTPSEWSKHPDRGEVPADLLRVVDGWFRTTWADLRQATV